MESTGLPGRIHISAATWELVRHCPRYQWCSRGEHQVKGKGPMVTYLMLEQCTDEHEGADDESEEVQVEDL